MRNFSFVFLAAILLHSGFCFSQQLSPIQRKAMVMRRVIELHHISPKPVDDSLSKSIFYHIIDQADGRRLLFTAAEYQQLAPYATKLDDELLGKSWGFLDLFTKLYKHALLRADTISSKALQQVPDYSINETITSSKNRTYNFASDRTVLQSRWTRYVKLRALEAVFQESIIDSSNTPFPSFLNKKEAAARERLAKAETRQLKRMLERPDGFEEGVKELYLNAVASVFDPHTNFFSPAGGAAFRNALSTEGLSFGLELDENEKQQFIISRLVPGGPAWKSGELHKGDVLLSMQWEGQPPVMAEALTLEEIYEFMEIGSASQRLRFKFRKADNDIREVDIRKAKMDNEENIVKSFVLHGEKKIGYLLLPGFYTEWENGTGSSCAHDVAREIVKLKREKIDGLILDVRFNGGGSMEEAVEMIGIFIDEGPLAGEKTREGKVRFVRDPNRGTVYDGPLVLMVNGQSASASEVMAAALQDYNRAVILGSNTFGKATMQQLLPIDTSKTNGGRNGDGEFVKVTSGKLYRLNGQSAQRGGIVVDIPVPDPFDGIEFGEKFIPHSLPADAIQPNQYYKKLPELPLNDLARKSKERVSTQPFLKEVRRLVERQLTLQGLTTRTVPLKSDLFFKWATEQVDFAKTADTDELEVNSYKLENHAIDRELLQNNPDADEVNTAWKKHLAVDRYIEEAFFVLRDLINLQATKP